MAARLAGKIAILFGAGQVDCDHDIWGNGRATAVAYAREGARVVAVDIDQKAVEHTRSCVAKEGHECVAQVADVTRHAEVDAVVEQTMKQFGRIDILHNNVGINQKGGPVEVSEENWDRVMQTNVKSLLITCKCVLPIMKRQGSGAIINIGSIAGIRGTGQAFIAYATSKAAVSHFTRVVALEYAEFGVRANTILPGLMDTPRIYGFGTDYYSSIEVMRKQRGAHVPMKRMGDAWDIANAAVFLASDEARYITAVELCVDGGLTARVGAGVLEQPDD